MKYLLDSDVVIDFEKSKEPGSTFFRKAMEQKAFMSVISFSEVMYGLLNNSYSEKFNFFEKILEDFGINLLSVSKNEVVEFTNLKLSFKKTIIPDFDLLIAATAIVNDLTLITRNLKHFSRIPSLKLFSPKSDNPG
ncbi:MAG: type II toxin-antitoxin system VapC family toxin [Patescibacteria group bacterium]